MSIIFRQSFKSSLYSYIGVIVGFAIVGILMPKFLTPAEIGVRMQIQSYALVLSSIIAFGIPQSIIRMFPHFENEGNKNHGILTLSLLVTGISAILFYAVFGIFAENFFESDIKNSALFEKFYFLILPFTIATLFFNVMDNYATAIKESTIGVFLRDVLLRILILIALVLFIYWDKVDYSEFIQLFTFIQYVPLAILIVFLTRKAAMHFPSPISFPSKEIRADFISVSLFGWINGLSNVAIVSIDSIMLSKLEDSATVGIYTTVFFFASLILIPFRSMGKITNSVVAQLFKENNLSAILSLYKKSALNSLIIGLFLFGNLILLIPFIFNVILKGYSEGLYVLLFIGLTNLITMGTGVKFIILVNSMYYRWTTYFLVGFMGLLVLTNVLFIPAFGMTGAAFASLLSNTIYQIVGLTFLKQKMNLWPFEWRQLQALGFAAAMGVLIYFVPDFGYPSSIAIAKAALYSLIFIGFVLKFKISQDLIQGIESLLDKIRSWKY